MPIRNVLDDIANFLFVELAFNTHTNQLQRTTTVVLGWLFRAQPLLSQSIYSGYVSTFLLVTVHESPTNKADINRCF